MADGGVACPASCAWAEARPRRRAIGVEKRFMMRSGRTSSGGALYRQDLYRIRQFEYATTAGPPHFQQHKKSGGNRGIVPHRLQDHGDGKRPRIREADAGLA